MTETQSHETIDAHATGVTPQEVYDLATEIMDVYNSRLICTEPTDRLSDLEREADFFDRVYAMNDRAGKGLQVGKLLSFSMGDGAAMYLVQDVRPRSVQVAILCLGDVYQCPFVTNNSTLPRSIAEPKACQNDAGLLGRRVPVFRHAKRDPL